MIDEAKAAIAYIEITKRFSKLKDSDGPLDALRKLQQKEHLAMASQFAQMLETKFSLSQCLRSPFHSIGFYKMRKQWDKRSELISRSDWISLRQLIIRIEFGFFMDFRSADVLKESIRKNLLTERDAWRLVHSLGCQIASGKLTPALVSSTAVTVGLVISALFSLLAITIFFSLTLMLVSDCSTPTCAIAGNALVATIFLLVARLAGVCSWGRRHAASVISSILEQDNLNGAIKELVVKKSLVLKMFWW